MEKRCYSPLLRITLVLNFLVLFVSFTGVTSAPITTDHAPSITSVMKNDSKLCEASKFLYNSTYVQECDTVPYPISPTSFDLELGTFLCLGVYDTAYKFCQYSSQHLIPTNISVILPAEFNLYMKQQIGLGEKRDQEQKMKFCNNMQGYTTLYNKTDYLWEPLVENINAPKICVMACFDITDKLRPLCAVLGWIKSIDDNIKKANKTRHGSAAFGNQLNDETTGDGKTVPSGARRTSEAKEANEPAPKPAITASKNDSNVKVDNSNAPTTAAKADVEETKSAIVKVNKDGSQKKTNKTETQDHKSSISSVAEGEKKIIPDYHGGNAEDAKSAKNTPANSNPQAVPVKNPADNPAPSKDVANEGNAQEYEKEQDTDDVKTSTISENTQDHYDVNPEEDVESNRADNLDDVDDAIPQPMDIGKEALSEGNQNDISQEMTGPKDNLQYSNARIEDESHFFTYFTVITVACIAGYIGYHNKQKILAIVLEGRRSRSSRSRRRPSTASYRKLDCTLEEAVTSQCNANVTHVIY